MFLEFIDAKRCWIGIEQLEELLGRLDRLKLSFLKLEQSGTIFFDLHIVLDALDDANRAANIEVERGVVVEPFEFRLLIAIRIDRLDLVEAVLVELLRLVEDRINRTIDALLNVRNFEHALSRSVDMLETTLLDRRMVLILELLELFDLIEDLFVDPVILRKFDNMRNQNRRHVEAQNASKILKCGKCRRRLRRKTAAMH